MNNWVVGPLASMAFGTVATCVAASLPPVPDNPQHAQTSLGFNINSRCPDLRIVEGGTRAVVVFWVPRRGVQSQIAIKTSSGSSELDAAAVACVAKLRFAPAVTLGDGESIDSWQQIALNWVDTDAVGAARPPAAPAIKAPVAPAAATAPALPAPRPPEAGTVTVRVCVDDKGKLQREPTIIQSSGLEAVDQAALKIAAAGAAYYRPSTPTRKPASPGCAQLAISFDP